MVCAISSIISAAANSFVSASALVIRVRASQVINYVLHKPSAADLTAIEAANRDTLAVMPQIFEGRIDKAMQALHT